MVKKELIKKEIKPNKYSTIIATKEHIKRLSEARDTWKTQNKNFYQVGLMPFIIYLLDEYENNRK